MDAELEEMRVEDQAERAEGRLSVCNLFTFRALRWQLVSIIVLMAGQQLSGVNAVSRWGSLSWVGVGISVCGHGCWQRAWPCATGMGDVAWALGGRWCGGRGYESGRGLVWQVLVGGASRMGVALVLWAGLYEWA